MTGCACEPVPILGLQIACAVLCWRGCVGGTGRSPSLVFFLAAKEGRKGKHSVVSMLSHGGVVLFNLSHSCVIQGRGGGSWGEGRS